MIAQVKTYLECAREVLCISADGINRVREGTLDGSTAREICRALKVESRRAMTNARLPGQHADARKALKALADDADRLRAMARKLI